MKFIILFIALLFSCCKPAEKKSIYSCNPDKSDSNGKAVSDSTFYFPDTLYSKKDKYYKDVVLKYASNDLYQMSEPLLSNCQLDYESYRFYWSKAFYFPLVFDIIKKDSAVYMDVKFIRYRKVFDNADLTTKYLIDSAEIDSSFSNKPIILPKDSNLNLNVRFICTFEQWDSLSAIMNKVHYWDLLSIDPQDAGFDGSDWLIEAHLKNRYHVVERWSPEGDFRKPGEYFLNICGYKREIY